MCEERQKMKIEINDGVYHVDGIFKIKKEDKENEFIFNKKEEKEMCGDEKVKILSKIGGMKLKKDFGKILVIDFIGEFSEIQHFSNKDQAMPNIENSYLSAKGKRMLEELFDYACRNDIVVDLDVISGDRLFENKMYSLKMKWQISEDIAKTYTFIMGVGLPEFGYHEELMAFAEKNNLLYFVSLRLDDIGKTYKTRYSNTFIMVQEEENNFVAEQVAIDLYNVFVNRKGKVEEIARYYQTNDRAELSHRLLALYIAVQLKNSIIGDDDSIYYDGWPKYVRRVIDKTFSLGLNEFFKEYPQHFKAEYNLNTEPHYDCIVRIEYYWYSKNYILEITW